MTTAETIRTEADHLAACLRIFLMHNATELPEAEAEQLGRAAITLDSLAAYFAQGPDEDERLCPYCGDWSTTTDGTHACGYCRTDEAIG